MQKEKLKELLQNKIVELQRMPYGEFLSLIKKTEIGDPWCIYCGTFGSEDFHQFEIEAWVEDDKTFTLRVVVKVDDGGWKAFWPMSADFFITPEGEFPETIP